MFATSTPATADGFFDRVEELARVEAAVAKLSRGAPKWLCLVGPRKVGKTSLLREVERRTRARHRSHAAFVMVDVLESLPATPALFRTVAIQAVDVLLARDAGQSLASLVNTPSAWRSVLLATRRFAMVPAALQALVLELPSTPATMESLPAMLSIPERLADALGEWLVIAIDEFQELATLARAHDVMALLRSTWQQHRRTTYVVSGSARSTLLELAASEHSPFFQHFEVLEIGGFNEVFAVRLLVEASRDAPQPISEALAKRVFSAVGGNPFYLQVVGEALAEERGTAEARLRRALQRVLFSETGRLALYFLNEFQRVVGRATTLAATLNALAAGPRTLSDVAAAIGATPAATHGYLARLGDAVQRTTDGRWEVTDRTFALWLEWRQPGGTVLPMRLVGDEAELAVAERLAQLGFELVYQSRGSRGPFDLLATRGARQLALQVKRSPLPLRFAKAAWQRMEAEGRRYGWQWVVAQVERSGKVNLLDPARAAKRGAVTITERAIIEHPLDWLEH